MLYVRLLFLLASGLLASCITPQAEESLPPQGPARCFYLQSKVDWKKPIEVLNNISDLFHNACYQETINVASKAREKFRFKKYSLSKEVAEIFLAEGAVTEYVLESYERGYLSFLTATSFIKLNQVDAASVELNKFYNEEVEFLYNHGQDPINALLQAALWDNHPREGFSSRPFWLWLSKTETGSGELREFARKRVKEMDSNPVQAHWEISELGMFPEVDWSMKFNSSQNGYFSIHPTKPFTSACTSASAILVPTSSWFHKIAIRHSHDYHPLVNLKSWIRLPFGMAYGITTLAAGASIIVGGCALEAAGKADGVLCQLSIHGGTALMAKSDDVVDYALRPDLRHWEKLPAAIYLNKKDRAAGNDCLQRAKELGIRRIL